MSWEEYKNKRNKNQDTTVISNNNSETSSWEQYKQKREQAKIENQNKQNNNTQRVNRKLDNSIRTTPLPSARKRYQEDNADKLKTAKEVSKEEYEANSFNKFKNDIINKET